MDPLLTHLRDEVASLRDEVAELRAVVGARGAKRTPTKDVADAIARVVLGEVRTGTRGSMVEMHRGRCVYFLIDGGAVIYVGRSVTGFRDRVESHRGKPWSRVVVVGISPGTGIRAEAAFNALELALIQHFKPPFNVADSYPSLSGAAEAWPASNAHVWGRIIAAASNAP